MLGGSLDGRGVWGRMDTCMYGWDPLLSTWNYHTLLIGYTPVQNKELKKKSPCLCLAVKHKVAVAAGNAFVKKKKKKKRIQKRFKKRA